MEKLEEREQIRKKYFVLKMDDQKLTVTQYATLSDDHDDDVREFCAFRNLFDRQMHFVDQENLDELNEL